MIILALKVKPDLSQAWDNRGVALMKLQQYQQAASSFDKALQIKLDHANSFSNKAYCYWVEKLRIQLS